MSNVLFTRVQHNPAFIVGGVRLAPASIFGGLREEMARLGKTHDAPTLASGWSELRYSLDALPINNCIDSQGMGGVKYRRDDSPADTPYRDSQRDSFGTMGGLGISATFTTADDMGITETGLWAQTAHNQQRVLVSRNEESRSH